MSMEAPTKHNHARELARRLPVVCTAHTLITYDEHPAHV
jgi:hypothetical protein